MPPALLDGAFQAALGLRLDLGAGSSSSEGSQSAAGALLPYAADSIEIFSGCGQVMHAIVRRTTPSRRHSFDIQLCDESGRICVEVTGLTARSRKPQDRAPVLLTRQWEQKELAARPSTSTAHHVFVCEGSALVSYEALERAVKARCPHAQIARLASGEGSLAVEYERQASQVLEAVRAILLAKPRGPVLLQLVVASSGQEALQQGLAAILKTARIENPNVCGQVIITDDDHAERLAEHIQAEATLPEEREVTYQDGQRLVASFRAAGERSFPETCASPWKNGGVYLVTGGTGGLGVIFAEAIAKAAPKAKLILAGRGEIGGSRKARIDALRANGVHVESLHLDVSNRAAVFAAIRSIRQRFGGLNGVIHAAGVLRDSFLIRKTQEDVRDVFASKVHGLVALDEATAQHPLDFFVTFSSGAASFGHLGQADYAAANAFMDHYMTCRARWVSQGARSGKSLSIGWPLWTDGGMKAADLGEETGAPGTAFQLKPHEGVEAFARALAGGGAHVVVAPAGSDEPLAAQTLSVADDESKTIATASIPADELRERTQSYLRAAMSRTLKIPLERIETDGAFEGYGIDSIIALRMTRELEKDFGSLAKTLLFDYRNLKELAEYFIESHRQVLERVVGMAEAPVAQQPQAPTIDVKTLRDTTATAAAPSDNRIAIVGLAGRYPQARTLDEFWENLKAGRNCVTEIPSARWDHDRYFDPQKGTPGKTYSRWGGFIDGVDEFDASFFNIGPREAQFMDPQERLFLQCVYETLEDAGYTRDSLASASSGSVGVFVGVMYEEYQLYGAQAQARGKPVALSGNPASIANRVSYFCNFRGPSLAVDTMCSSSLTAIHLACRSIMAGECKAAVAGGVNVSIHPNK
jgi:polyketide synthase PksN